MNNSQEGREGYVDRDRDDFDYFGAKKVVEKEFAYIRKRRGLADEEKPPRDLCGLALSGGGIRSASFSLGVMQALAHNDWLKKIDYLSTVSGGGYIGASLTWFLNQDYHFSLSGYTFPYASFPMSGRTWSETQRGWLLSKKPPGDRIRSGRILNFLRQNAEYLTPGDGLNLFSLAWIVLRGACLGMLVYGSLLTFIFIFAGHYGAFGKVCAIPLLPEAIGHFLLTHLHHSLKNWFLLTAVLGSWFFAISIPVYSLATYFFNWIFRKKAYPLRRWCEVVAGKGIPILLLLALVGLMPGVRTWVKKIGETTPAKAGQVEITGQNTSAKGFSFVGTITPMVKSTPPPDQSSPCPNTTTQPPEEGSLATKIRHSIGRELHALFTGLVTILIGFGASFWAFFNVITNKSQLSYDLGHHLS